MIFASLARAPRADKCVPKERKKCPFSRHGNLYFLLQKIKKLSEGKTYKWKRQQKRYSGMQTGMQNRLIQRENGNVTWRRRVQNK